MFKRLISAMVLCGAAAPAVADNLLEVYQLAVDNDPQFAAAVASRDVAVEALPQATSGYLPKLNAFGSWTEKSQDVIQTFPGASTGTILGSDANASVTLRQPLLSLSTLAARRVAKANVAQAELQLEQAEQDLMLRVAETYFDVLAKMENLNFARAEKQAIARQLEQARQRFDVGLIAVTDVHEAQARHDLAVAQEIAAENNLAIAREQLREITGQLHNNLRQLRDQTPLVPPSPTNIDDWTQAAREQNLGVLVARRNVEAAQHNISQQRSARYPTVDATGSYGYFRNESSFTQESTTAAVGLEMSMNIFQGGFISSKVSEARAQLRLREQNLEQTLRNSLRLTRASYLGVLAGMSHVKALSQALVSSQSALQATEAGFEVGTRTAVDVLDAQRELFRARRDYAQARYNYVLDTLRLKHAVGMLTREDLRQINSWLQ